MNNTVKFYASSELEKRVLYYFVYSKITKEPIKLNEISLSATIHTAVHGPTNSLENINISDLTDNFTETDKLKMLNVIDFYRFNSRAMEALESTFTSEVILKYLPTTLEEYNNMLIARRTNIVYNDFLTTAVKFKLDIEAFVTKFIDRMKVEELEKIIKSILDAFSSTLNRKNEETDKPSPLQQETSQSTNMVEAKNEDIKPSAQPSQPASKSIKLKRQPKPKKQTETQSQQTDSIKDNKYEDLIEIC